MAVLLHTTFPLRKVNNVLSVAVILICLYIITYPLLPQMAFWYKNIFGVSTQLVKDGKNTTKSNYPEQNTLVVPTLNMQELVYEGNTDDILKLGVWRRPMSSTPDKQSNTVLAGHRFTYSDPAVFYHLDKIKQGDEIILYWQKKKYIYRTASIKEVPPTAGEVELPTKDPVLTMYTCAPLWSLKNRLVVQANLIEVQR